jgi:hypothetical protein
VLRAGRTHTVVINGDETFAPRHPYSAVRPVVVEGQTPKAVAVRRIIYTTNAIEALNATIAQTKGKITETVIHSRSIPTGPSQRRARAYRSTAVWRWG